MTVQQAPAGNAITPVDVAALPTLDNVNGMTLALDGRTGLIVYNQDASAHTITLNVTTDVPYGRAGTAPGAYSVVAGHVAIFPEFPANGWNSGGGNLLNIDANFAMSYLAIQRNPTA